MAFFLLLLRLSTVALLSVALLTAIALLSVALLWCAVRVWEFKGSLAVLAVDEDPAIVASVLSMCEIRI